MFFSNTGFTIFPPTRIPVVLQYRMFVPDLRFTWNRIKQAHRDSGGSSDLYFGTFLAEHLTHPTTTIQTLKILSKKIEMFK